VARAVARSGLVVLVWAASLSCLLMPR